jgi:hypothetical protein
MMEIGRGKRVQWVARENGEVFDNESGQIALSPAECVDELVQMFRRDGARDEAVYDVGPWKAARE